MVRLRHRYVVLEVVMEGDWKQSEGKTRHGALYDSIVHSIRRLHGIHGVAVSKNGLFVNYLSAETKIACVQMQRSAYKIVGSSIALVTSIEREPVTLRTIYTGATRRQCNLFLQKHHRRTLETKYGSLTSDVQREKFKNELLNCPVLPITI